MNRFTILFLCLISSPITLAETFYGLGFTQLNFKDSYVEANAFTGVIGYQLGKRNFTLNPQFRYMKTNQSNGDYQGDITLDNAFIFSLKGQYTFNNGAYFFTSPAFGSFNYLQNSRFFYNEESEFELGLNIGIGYEFNKYLSTEITYDKFKRSKAVTAGINFRW